MCLVKPKYTTIASTIMNTMPKRTGLERFWSSDTAISLWRLKRRIGLLLARLALAFRREVLERRAWIFFVERVFVAVGVFVERAGRRGAGADHGFADRVLLVARFAHLGLAGT